MKRVICTLYHFDNIINYAFVCLDKNGPVVNVEYEFSISVDTENEFSVETLRKRADEVTKRLEEIDYAKKPIIINLDLQSIFVERITLPKLSFMEFRKSLNLSLENLYTGFAQKFCYVTNASNNKNQGVDVAVTMCEKTFYAKSIYIPSNCSCKVEKVVLASYALKQFVLENNFFPKERNFIYINIDKLYTMVIFAKGSKVINHQTFYVGTENLDQILAVRRDLTIEEARKVRLETPFLEDTLEICEELLKPVISYIKMLGGTYPQEEIFNVRLHSEDYSNEDFVKVLSQEIPSCSLSPVELDIVTKTSFITMAAMTTPDKNYDPDMPITVK